MFISIDASEIARIGPAFSSVGARIPKIVEPRMQRMADVINQRAKSNINHQSGRLGRSGKVTKIGSMVYEVRFEAFNRGFNYASAIEFGRGPVRPIRAKFLAIPFAGGIIFSKYARPAPAQRFLARGVEQSQGAIDARVTEIENDIVRAIEAAL